MLNLTLGMKTNFVAGGSLHDLVLGAEVRHPGYSTPRRAG